MSLTDPQSVTITGVTTPLPRISVGDDRSEYQSADGLILLSASHNYAKRARRMLRLDVSKLTADPHKPAENVKVSMSCYMVIDTPPAGFTLAEAHAVYVGLNSLYTASSHAAITKLLGGES